MFLEKRPLYGRQSKGRSTKMILTIKLERNQTATVESTTPQLNNYEKAAIFCFGFLLNTPERISQTHTAAEFSKLIKAHSSSPEAQEVARYLESHA